MTDQGYFRVGDVVTLNTWAYRRPLIITGFRPLIVDRFHGYERTPGVYQDRQFVSLASEDGFQCDGVRNHGVLRHYSDKVAKARGLRPKSASPLRIRDLPDTGFWEGDLVRLPDRSEVFVTAIDYMPYVLGSLLEHGQLQPFVVNEKFLPVRIQRQTNRGTEQRTIVSGRFVRRAGLELVSRGNAWRYHAGETLTFSTLDEEIRFHLMNGWFTYCDRTHTTAQKALQCVQRGEADGFFSTGGSLQFKEFHSVKLTRASRELCDRFALACLEAPVDNPVFQLS